MGLDNRAFDLNSTKEAGEMQQNKVEMLASAPYSKGPWYTRKLTIAIAFVVLVLAIVIAVSVWFATKSGQFPPNATSLTYILLS